MTAMAVVGGQLKLSPDDRQLLWGTYLPWATRTGLRCADLMCIYYEEHFEEDLEDLRRRWRIVPAPPPPQHLAPKGRAATQGSTHMAGGGAAPHSPQMETVERQQQQQQQEEKEAGAASQEGLEQQQQPVGR
jgi:hypothetical protein